MSDWDATRALELVTGENVNYDESDWLEACRDMLRAAVDAEARWNEQHAHQHFVNTRQAKEIDRLAADLRNEKYANEHAVLALKEALAEVERLNGVIEAYQLNRQWEQEHLANALADNATLRAECVARHDDYIALYSDYADAQGVLLALIARLEAAEKCIEQIDVNPALCGSYVNAWRAVRDAKEGTNGNGT